MPPFDREPNPPQRNDPRPALVPLRADSGAETAFPVKHAGRTLGKGPSV
jgi:hypothetical protein